MIHIVTSASRHLFEDDLLELCRNDRAGFAGGNSRFDGDDGVYLLAAEKGRVCGGARLRPSSGRSMPPCSRRRALPGIDAPMLIGRPPCPSVPREIVS